MSSSTAKLGLTSNSLTDPFSLSDFNKNWGIIDGAPGTYVCTSSTRPTWGSAQAGRKIVETDTRRELLWTGTAWAEPAVATGQWGFFTNPNQTLAPNARNTYTLGTINVQRPCTVALFATVRAEFRPFLGQWLSADIQVDGTTRTLGIGAYLQWADLSSANSTGYDARNASWFGQVALSKGNHTISAYTATGGAAGATVWLTHIACMALVVAPVGGTVTP